MKFFCVNVSHHEWHSNVSLCSEIDIHNYCIIPFRISSPFIFKDLISRNYRIDIDIANISIDQVHFTTVVTWITELSISKCLKRYQPA